MAVDQVAVRKTMGIVIAHDWSTFAGDRRLILDGKGHDLSPRRGDADSKPLHARVIELHLIPNFRHAARLREFATVGSLNQRQSPRSL